MNYDNSQVSLLTKDENNFEVKLRNYSKSADINYCDIYTENIDWVTKFI